MTKEETAAGQAGGDRPSRSGERKVVTTERLLEGAREIGILHDGREYRLQVTRNGKLILTK